MVVIMDSSNQHHRIIMDFHNYHHEDYLEYDMVLRVNCWQYFDMRTVVCLFVLQ